MHRKNIFCKIEACFLLPAVLFSFAGCGAGQEQVPELLEPVAASTEIDKVAYRDVYTLKVADTHVIPELSELCFGVDGTFGELTVSVGQEVKEGDVLARMMSDTDYYETLLEQWDRLEADYAYSNRLLEIQIEQYTLVVKDTARKELELAQSKEVQELEEAYLKKKIALEKKKLSVGKITAPNDGVIASCSYFREGDTVSEDTPIVVLANDSVQYVTGEYMSKKGADTTYRFYAIINGKEYELEYVYDENLTVSEYGMDGVISRYRVVDGTPDLVGAYAVLCQVKEYSEHVLSVPVNALYSDGAGYYVYVMDGDTKVQTVVSVGVKGTMYAEITDGLREGELVYVKE